MGARITGLFDADWGPAAFQRKSQSGVVMALSASAVEFDAASDNEGLLICGNGSQCTTATRNFGLIRCEWGSTVKVDGLGTDLSDGNGVPRGTVICQSGSTVGFGANVCNNSPIVIESGANDIFTVGTMRSCCASRAATSCLTRARPTTITFS